MALTGSTPPPGEHRRLRRISRTVWASKRASHAPTHNAFALLLTFRVPCLHPSILSLLSPVRRLPALAPSVCLSLPLRVRACLLPSFPSSSSSSPPTHTHHAQHTSILDFHIHLPDEADFMDGITMADDNSTVAGPCNNASVVESAPVCSGMAYVIDTVLLPGGFCEDDNAEDAPEEGEGEE